MKRRTFLSVLLLCVILGVSLVSCVDNNPPAAINVDDPSACTHTFGEWEITVNPTCLDAGERVRCCTLCNTSETEKIDALGHNLVTIEAVAATDIKRGSTEGEGCSRCSYVSVEPQSTDCKMDEIAKNAATYMNTIDTFFSDVSEQNFTFLQAADMYGTYFNLSTINGYFVYAEDYTASVDVNALPSGIIYENREGVPFLYYSVPYADWKAWTTAFLGKEIDCRTEQAAFGLRYHAKYNADTDCVVFEFCAYGGMGGFDWRAYFESDGTYTEAADNQYVIGGKYYTNVKPENDAKYEKTTVMVFDWDVEDTVTLDVWVLPVALRVSYSDGAFHLVSLLICE